MRRACSWVSLTCLLSLIPSAALADEHEGHVEFLPEEPDVPPLPSTSKPPLRFEATVGGVFAVPFANQPGETAFGFGLTYGVAWGAIPVMFGLDFISAGGGSGDSFVSGPSESDLMQFHKETQNRTLYFDAWLRVQPRDWPVRPYVEGFAGARLAMLHYSLSSGDSNSDATVWSDAQEWSSSLGWGAGVDFAGLLQIADTVSFTLGARRLHGKHVSFTLEGSVSGDSVSTQHDVAGSVTLFMLGIVAWFDLGKPS